MHMCYYERDRRTEDSELKCSKHDEGCELIFLEKTFATVKQVRCDG